MYTKIEYDFAIKYAEKTFGDNISAVKNELILAIKAEDTANIYILSIYLNNLLEKKEETRAKIRELIRNNMLNKKPV